MPRRSCYAGGLELARRRAVRLCGCAVAVAPSSRRAALVPWCGVCGCAVAVAPSSRRAAWCRGAVVRLCGRGRAVIPSYGGAVVPWSRGAGDGELRKRRIPSFERGEMLPLRKTSRGACRCARSSVRSARCTLGRAPTCAGLRVAASICSRAPVRPALSTEVPKESKKYRGLVEQEPVSGPGSTPTALSGAAGPAYPAAPPALADSVRRPPARAGAFRGGRALARAGARRRRPQPFAAFAAAFAACFVARTLASDSGSTMSATERCDPSSP